MNVGVSVNLVKPVKPTCRGCHAVLALLLIGAVACAEDDTDVPESQTVSALDTRFVDGHTEKNVARLGIATSSNPTGFVPRHPAWTINDGRRGAPMIDMGGGVYDYAYWNSYYPPTNYNCNYSNQWWVSVKFSPRVGEVCLGGNCVRNIREIDLFSLRDDYRSGAEPTPSTLTNLFTNIHFQLQYCPAGVTCYTNGSGWVVAPGGYISWNNKAWVSISFAPVAATAVRAQFLCAQEQWAYAVELEAWERVAPSAYPNCPSSTSPSPIPSKDVVDDVAPYVGNDNSSASKIADADRFWWKYFPAGDSRGETSFDPANGKPDDVDAMNEWLKNDSPCPPPSPMETGCINIWWYYGDRAAALVQMYDLLAPIDFPRALVYLERLRLMSDTFLKNRDDNRSPKRWDWYHEAFMPAWGFASLAETGGNWLAPVDMSSLFTYPMAAFARRVAEHPDWFCLGYRQDAIRFTTAVLDTYNAYKLEGDMQLTDPRNPAWSNYVDPLTGKPYSFNLSLLPLRGLVEVARAADSELYRGSLDASPTRLDNATKEAPRFIAESIKWFLEDSLEDEVLDGDGTPWYWWHYNSTDHGSDKRWPEDLSHAQLTLGTLLHVWENRSVIDGLLARYGYPERVAGSTMLNSTLFTRIANTFLRRVWRYDYSGLNGDLLTDRIDGPNSPDEIWPTPEPFPTVGWDCDGQPCNANRSTTGFLPLTPFDPWVWVRSRDSAYNLAISPPPDCIWDHYAENSCHYRAVNVANHAALLRYR